MAARKRINIQKCEDFVGFEELEGGDVAYPCQLAAASSVRELKGGNWMYL